MKCKNCSGNIPTYQREREKSDCICSNPTPYSAEFYSMSDQLNRIERSLTRIEENLGTIPRSIQTK